MKIDNKRLSLLKEFEENIGYSFKDKSLLDEAFVHSSYSNENENYKHINNERLEFLGDVVLGLIVSKKLFELFDEMPEGDLTKFRSQIVCESTFASCAEKLNMGKYLLLSKGEELTGGKKRKSILADTFEAVSAAIYLDSSIDILEKLYIEKFEDFISDKIYSKKLFIDYKTKLQEYFHKEDHRKVNYAIEKEEGPDHDKTFYMIAYYKNEEIGRGFGKNKKLAEQMAAKDAFLKLEKNKK